MRSDSLTRVIVTAAARITRPISWPPIRRAASGKLADTSVTCTLPPDLCGSVPGADAEGEIVGNTDPGFGSVGTGPGGNPGTPPPGTGGSGTFVPTGGVGTGVEPGTVTENPADAVAVPGATAWAELAWTVRPTTVPFLALAGTTTCTCSSARCPPLRPPTWQRALPEGWHTVNVAGKLAGLVVKCSDAEPPRPDVSQTKTAYRAAPPGSKLVFCRND